MGYSVLLSNYRRYFKLASYLATHTRESIVIAMGLPSLEARPPPCRRPWGRSLRTPPCRLDVGLPSIEARPPAAARGGVPFGHLHAGWMRAWPRPRRMPAGAPSSWLAPSPLGVPSAWFGLAPQPSGTAPHGCKVGGALLRCSAH